MNMSTCSNCGRETKGNAKFCSACGRSLVEKDGSLKDKKARVTAQETKWNKPLVIAAVLIVALGALWFGKGIIMKMRMGDRPMFAPLRDPAARLAHATAVTSEGGEVRIPAAALEDGNA